MSYMDQAFDLLMQEDIRRFNREAKMKRRGTPPPPDPEKESLRRRIKQLEDKAKKKDIPEPIEIKEPFDRFKNLLD